MQEFGQASAVRVEIDSVIFADGEVVGNNLTAFDSEIRDRKAAAASIIATLQKVGTDPQARRTALLGIASQGRAAADASAVWQHRFAQQVLRARDPLAIIDYLSHLPGVPTFYGNTTETSIQRGPLRDSASVSVPSKER